MNTNNANPFDKLEEKLNGLSSQVHDLRLLITQTHEKKSEQKVFNKIPIQEIFRQKLMSKPTFYFHVKTGNIILHKLGNRSFVNPEEFEKAFRRVKIREVLPCITIKSNFKNK